MSAEFSLLRFEASPVSATVALVELDGEFAHPAPARVRLLVERGGHGVEVPAITSGGQRPWTATFAIAMDDLVDERTEFSLAPGRGPLIALPTPSVSGGPDEDRYVRLARQANDLRHRLGEAAAAAAQVHEVRAELAAARHQAEQQAAELRAEIASVTERAEQAEKDAKDARVERQEAVDAKQAAQAELATARDQLRETESRLTDTERERAALRARAESADRTLAELTSRAEELEQRVREAEAEVVAAEDETRLARRDLRDTRARLEAVLREQRHPAPARRGHEVPEPDDDNDDADAQPDVDDVDDAADTPDAEAEPKPEAGPNGENRTEVLETREIGAAEDPPADDGAPRATAATATRATRIVRISDEPDEAPDTADREARHSPAPLDPGRVGASHISPAESHPAALTPARIMVGIALLLLVAALVAIILGAGLV